MKIRLLLPLLIGSAFFIGLSRADTLVSFTPHGFTQGGPSPWDELVAPDTIEIHPGVELKHGLERGKGLTKGGTAEGWGGSGWAAPDAAAAIAEGDYFTVTIAPRAGKTLSFSEIQSIMFRGKTSASNYLWQYRLGGGDFVNIGEPLCPQCRQHERDARAGKPQRSCRPARRYNPVTFRMIGWGAETKTPPGALGKPSPTPC